MAQSDQPSIRLSLSKSVLGVELFDLIGNKRIATYHREGSRCSFSEQIAYKRFELTLRLDWGDTKNDEPTLDLDVVQIHKDGARKNIRATKLVSHHTSLSAYLAGSLSPRTYDLEFQGLTMRLVARKTYAMSTVSRCTFSTLHPNRRSKINKRNSLALLSTTFPAETIGCLDQKFFGRRAGRGLDSGDLYRVCFQKIV